MKSYKIIAIFGSILILSFASIHCFAAINLSDLPELDLGCVHLLNRKATIPSVVSLKRHRLHVSRNPEDITRMGYVAQEHYLVGDINDDREPSKTRVGAEVVVDLLPNGNKLAQRLVGRIVSVWMKGFEMINEDGHIFSISLDTPISALYLKTNQVKWQIPRFVSEFQKNVEEIEHPFVIMPVSVDDKNRFGHLAMKVLLSGRVSFARYHGALVYVIENALGVRHVIDPTLLRGHFSWAFVTSANDELATELSILDRSVAILNMEETSSEKLADQRSIGLFRQLVYRPGTSFMRTRGNLSPVQVDLLLLSPERLRSLPEGTVVWDWTGARYVVGEDSFRYDTEPFWNNMTGFGLKPDADFVERILPSGVVPLSPREKK